MKTKKATKLLPYRYHSKLKMGTTIVLLLVGLGIGGFMWRRGQAEMACVGVMVRPGQDIQAAISDGNVNDTFCFEPGIYRFTRTLTPKAGNKFVAKTPRMVIWTGDDGNDVPGDEDVTIAMNGEGVPRVELHGLVVEKFLAPRIGGLAAIKGHDSWIFDNNEFRFNNADIYHESFAKITSNYFHDSWTVGGGFKARGVLFENNEVANMNPNNYADAVTKWTGTRDLVVRGNYVHHNKGNGIWVDGDNINFIVENNRIEHNASKGLHYEISCAGVMRNNIVIGNGEVGLNLVASQDAQIYDNYFKDNGQGAIFVWHQNRGGGENCEWTVKNNRIFSNLIQQDGGFTGVRLFGNTDGDTIYDKNDGRVKFYGNTYYNSIPKPFYWMNNIQTKETWQTDYGQDTGSTFLTSTPLPFNMTKPGDTDRDNDVDGIDLSRVLTNFGKALPSRFNGDLDSNELVDGLDLSRALTTYGT